MYSRPLQEAPFTGQRTPHAPPGAETGGAAKGEISRPQTHVRNSGIAKRSGHQDRLRDAGPLQRRVYPGYLHPRHHLGKGGGGQRDGQYPLRCSPVVFGHFAVWGSAWVKALPQIFPRIILTQKQKKGSGISRFQNLFGCGDRT